ncbi:hypothetical protein BO94DRAFT_554249 [Aspergillus sclerotioniger CBS 115572]|uniref:Major facilitator superfamily (MFS) profile domain-containing protein n=1 Tax=Aspergillus sclerotioniger CBS 115572 TaxID=1450535 RepID=A0A317X989_9EURO|nr:hypothetical protein BO94DRAFT_554249 [Aspergillus sclerotioniger CBS 115572]PWY93488.1 hypothetical protein BO94DRAFT_554249 [Aspergillus sclerotioniger CBS 115572]
MHIPVNFRQFDIRQDGPGNVNNINPATNNNNNNTDGGHDSSSSSHSSNSSDKNNIVIICVACIIFVLASSLMIYFVLRTLRRMDCRPKYLPGKFLKDKWNRWNVGVTYGQVPDGSSSNNQNANATRAGPSERGAEMRTTTAPPAANNTSNVRRDTSVRSVITLPAYSASPKPTEQVIAREGEREGMDMVVEFPETAEEEENRREELMESLYQIRLQRRDELAEREWRRQERREARERGDYIRVEQLRQESRARQRNRISANGSGSNLSAALAESRNRGRDRRISSVSYAELGHVRHDGSRIRASSPDSDRRPLLNDASGANTDTPDRSSGSILTGVHSRGESYSSYQSGTSDADTLTQVQSHATSTHSADHPSPGTDESDVGALHIPPPEYEDLDWGEAPPYTSPIAETSGHAPQLRELTTLPTIHIDVASPISNTPTTPTNPLREEQHSAEQHSAGRHPTEAPSEERICASHIANMSREATTNSFASFGSDFDPEHEALASTKELGGSPRLPSMNKNARKRHEFEEEEPDYAFNTSTFEQYLPDFSPIGTSEEEADHDDDSISIEAGRGPANPPRRLDDSRNSYMTIENSVRSSSPAVRLDYPTSNTPQKSAMRNPARRAVSESLRKDAQIRRASLAQKENVDPQTAKSNRREQRRTLSEMHAKVRDAYEGSLIEDERPPAVANSTRPTRFGNLNLSHQIADAVEKASQEAYARELRRGKANTNSRSMPNSAGDTGTQHSFLLPDLPNLSELVSGVYEDGTPVYARQSRSRTTRFVSPQNDATDVSLTREHMPLDAVPIPEDEKALFVSLRLLQDKVSELERSKTEAERRMDEMKRENESLRTTKSRNKDKHGRSRPYESEEDQYRRDRLSSDNQKLDAANLALQNKLDIIERKTQIQESTLKRLNRERDMAVSQLGVAYLETQDLKGENESLRQEILDLKSQLTKILSAGPRNRDDTVDSELSSSLTDASDDDSQLDTQRSKHTSRSTREVTGKSSRSRSKAGRQEDSRAKVSTQVDKEISRLEKERAEEALFSLDVPQIREKSRTKAEKSKSRSQTSDVNSKKQSNTGKQRVKRVVVEEVDVTEPLESSGEVTGNTRKSSATEQDLTLLSFVDEREIAQLRKTLEEERLARKRRQSNTNTDQTANETGNTTRQSVPKSTVPRKSSLKESKGVPSRPASAMDLTAPSKASMAEGDSNLSVPVERPRRHSDHSAPAAAQRRRRRIAEEMTSAFILPDITFNPAHLADNNLAKLPEPAQRALDSATQHNGKNCTVCKRSIPDGSCDHPAEAVKIPKPIPVSERMPEPSPYNEEPTMRPAQSPELALATVLKALEDELAHLKMQLVAYQGAYNKLDASLSKRQRKSVGEKIEKLLKDIDMKADQIYALYDVLEGQKQNGREMTEQEMEVTLQSIGIDTAGRAADVTATTDKSSRKGPEPDYDEDDDELPWEGFEISWSSPKTQFPVSTIYMTSTPHNYDARSLHTDYVDTPATDSGTSRVRKDPFQPENQFLSPTISLNSYADGDEESVNTAIHDGSSAQTRILAPAPEFIASRRLSVDIANSSDDDNDSDGDDDDDDDDEHHSSDTSDPPNEKPVTWSSLPKKSQLAILTIARLSEPLTQTSLQAYMFYQLKSFDPSLPDSTISTQAGILQGSFTAAQFLTAVWWGRLADAEWMGRKRVLLIGSLGTCISCLGFGFSKSFVAAAVFRTLGGALNSNVGVMRTMIAEIIEEKKYQSRAFLLLPMCFNVGVIIGPILGGALADPLKSYPHLFGPGTLLGGDTGVGWMRKWPFALPNLLSAIFIFFSLVAVFFGLDETHEVARYRSDWGRKLGRKISRAFARRRGRYYRRLMEHPDDESLYVDGSIASRSAPSTPLRSRARPRHKRPSFGQIWTPNVLLTLLAQFLLAFHTSAFNSMTFTFLPTPRAPKDSQDGWFHFGGGLGLPSSRVGMATAIIGIIGLPLQIFVYPWVQGYLGTLPSFQTFLPFSSLAYALMPFLLIVPRVAWMVWPAFTIVIGLQVISRTFALPAAVILVNNSVSDPSVLGTINGVSQSISSAARTLGPFIGGWGLGLGLDCNFVGGIWWALALEALAGWFVLFFIYEGKGIEKKKHTEDIEEGEERR